MMQLPLFHCETDSFVGLKTSLLTHKGVVTLDQYMVLQLEL